MSSTNKLDYDGFYGMIRSNFPSINDLPVWAEYNYKEEGFSNCFIMSQIAEEMINWAINGNYSAVKVLLGMVENAFINGDDSVIAYLGTDFTVTILECKNKIIREEIKSLMGPETFHGYQLNLRGYKESD